MINSFSASFKVVAIVALLSNVTGAMEKAVPVTPVATAAVVVNKAAEPIVGAKNAVEKKGFELKGSICKAWTNVSTAVATKKAEIFAIAKDMKARGFNQWTTQEKAGVIIGGTVVAATAAYLVYKVYKSFTAPKAKVKVTVRANRP